MHGTAMEKYGRLGSFKRCLSDHARFHKEAGLIAAAINAERFSEAEKMIDNGTPYTIASQSVRESIMQFQKETKL